MRLNGSLGKHIGFAFQFAVFIKHFKGGKQSVGTVGVESGSIRPAVNQSVFLRKVVVKRVQLLLRLLNLAVGIILGLPFDKFSHAVTNDNHTFNAVFRSRRDFHRRHF